MDDKKEDLNESDSTEASILSFAQSLGEETKDNFKVFLYRWARDEETGKYKKKFLASLDSKQPDIDEIANRFRGGSYLLSFVYKKGNIPKSKSFMLDIDEDSFPILPKNINGSTNTFPMMGNSNLSESMQLQLMTLQSVSEIMKEAYRGGNQGAVSNRFDPMEQFSGIMETVENTMQRTISIQQSIMERVFKKSMETRYGLLEENTPSTENQISDNPNSVISQYTPMIREIVDGLKTVFSFFGDKVPEKLVQQVKSDERFKSIAKDPQALMVIGQALRKEFGDDKAGEIMKSFGVKMIIKKPIPVRETPNIPQVTQKALKPSIPLKAINGTPNNITPLKAKKESKEGK